MCVGRPGKELIERLADQSGQGGAEAFASFAPGATVELPGGATASPADFIEGCAALAVRDLLASGPTVSGLASIDWGARSREAAFVAELDAAGTQLRRLRWFWEA